MSSPTPAPTFEVCLDSDWAQTALIDDVRRGMNSSPRTLSPKWLYDNRGSELFDAITRLPEYYPTECEREILLEHADEIAHISGATMMVELGSGTSDKTRVLLDAFSRSPSFNTFVPIDVSEATLRDAADRLSHRYPQVAVHGIVGDFTLHLSAIPHAPRRMVAFLGGTIGNLFVEERQAFLAVLADVLNPGDTILLGTDLVKSADRLIAAYNDSSGVTAQFVTNALHVLNREMDADFDSANFDYVPFWDASLERMDLRLRSTIMQKVHLAKADLHLDLKAGEEIRVEISTKFRPESIESELVTAGYDVEAFWTDVNGDFALTLARVV